jgi:hypothetical protein
MTSKLKGIKVTPKKRSKETNPLKISETLTLRGTVENIWDPQSEALRNWESHQLWPVLGATQICCARSDRVLKIPGCVGGQP